jgi:hypothetical protein
MSKFFSFKENVNYMYNDRQLWYLIRTRKVDKREKTLGVFFYNACIHASVRDSHPDEPHPLIHGPILVDSFMDLARVARPLCTAHIHLRDDPSHPRRPSQRCSPSQNKTLLICTIPTPMDSACVACRRCPPSRDGLRSPTPPLLVRQTLPAPLAGTALPPSGLVPPIAAALHPPTATTAEVRAGVKLLKDEIHSSK